VQEEKEKAEEKKQRYNCSTKYFLLVCEMEKVLNKHKIKFLLEKESLV
jgi:hypothetical protein